MKRVIFPLPAAVIIALALWLLPHVAQAQAQPQAQSPAAFLPVMSQGPAPLCRFGVNGAPQSYPIEPLRVGWYMDYQATLNPKTPGGIEYFPTLRLEQIGADGYNYSIFGEDMLPTTPAQLNAVIDNNPGAHWFIGNEPDRIFWQDDMEPRAYARAYHDLYTLIKQRDPSAKIIAGAIVQPTPVRLQYLDLVLQNYTDLYGEKMPVDVWAFHNFILNEASCSYYATQYPNDPDRVLSICWGADIPPGINAVDGLRIDVQDNDDIELFKQQVIAFRTWMADNGYRNVPVFLSEYGVLMPQGIFNPDFDAARVNAFMNASFDFLLNATDPNIGYPGDGNRLVQRFSWYSVDDNVDHNGFLFNRDLPAAVSRTSSGDNFYQYTSQIARQVDFYPISVARTGAPATLEAVIHNSGNLEITTDAIVRFFNGNPATGGTQIGEQQEIQLPGCGESARVTTTWEGAAPGQYEIYVQVSTYASETNTSNNTIHATVQIGN